MMKATIDYKAAGLMWLAWQMGREIGTEVSGVAIMSPDHTIQNAQVLLQEATGAETEIDADALMDWFLEQEDLFNQGFIPVHWHTHPAGLGPKPSGGDRKQYKAWQSQFAKFLAIIIDGTNYALYPHSGLDWPMDGQGDVNNYHLPETDALTYADYFMPECYGAWLFDDATAVKDEAENIVRLVKKPAPLPPVRKNGVTYMGPYAPSPSHPASPTSVLGSNNEAIKVGEKTQNKPLHSLSDEEWGDYMSSRYTPTYNKHFDDDDFDTGIWPNMYGY